MRRASAAAGCVHRKAHHSLLARETVGDRPETMPRYNDEFRASSVLLLEAAGYPRRPAALEEVAARVKVSSRQLRRWYDGSSNPPPDRIVGHKKLDLRKAIQTELAEIFESMGGARADASYRDLGTVAGILFDKLALLNGDSTQNSNQRIIICCLLNAVEG